MTNPIDLHALADGQLEKPEVERLRAQCKADPAHAAELDAILNLKDFLREKSLRHTNEESWRACVSRLDGLDRTKRVEGVVGRYAWALCAGLFVMILGARYAIKGVRGDSVQAADIIRPFGSIVKQPAPQNGQAMDRWLDEMLGTGFVPQIDPNRVRVVSGARGFTPDGVPVTRIGLRDGDGPMALFVVPGMLNLQDTAPMPGDPPVYAGVMGNLNCVTWNAGGHTLVLAGSRDPEQLRNVVSKITTQNP